MPKGFSAEQPWFWYGQVNVVSRKYRQIRWYLLRKLISAGEIVVVLSRLVLTSFAFLVYGIDS